MDAPFAVSLVSLAISTGSLYVSIRQPFRDHRLNRTQKAADSIIAAVQDLRAAIWEAAVSAPDPSLVIERVSAVERACSANRRSLPPTLAAVGREVREAAGNYLGGPAGYTIHPGLKGQPFSPHDDYWWDITVTYLTYVTDTLGRWQDSPTRHIEALTPFHRWRREEDPDHHTLSNKHEQHSLASRAPDPRPTET